MTFRKELRAHRGGLLRLKTALYWYGGRGWDERLDRVCLLLDAKTCYGVRAYVDACGRNAAFGGGGDSMPEPCCSLTAHPVGSHLTNTKWRYYEPETR